MLLNQDCIYYYSCAKTPEECLDSKLISHTEVKPHIDTELQKQFDTKFGFTISAFKSTKMVKAVQKGASNDVLEAILDEPDVAIPTFGSNKAGKEKVMKKILKAMAEPKEDDIKHVLDEYHCEGRR